MNYQRLLEVRKALSMTNQNSKKPTRLLWEFLLIGFFTFGGGWSIIAQLYKKYVEEQKLISADDLTNITSVGRSLPGIMVLNVSMLLGFRLAGILGGIACMIGISIPPFAILLVITSLYELIGRSPFLLSAMIGVRAAVVPIIAYAAMTMFKSAVRDIPCVLVFLLCFVCYFFFGFSCIAVVLIGGVCGWLVSDYNEKRGAA